MSAVVGFGIGTGFGGREAAMQAAHQALDGLGAARPILILLVSAQKFNMVDVMAGLNILLGDTPIWGTTTTCPLSGDGEQPGSVVIAIIGSSSLKVQVQWWPELLGENAHQARQFLRVLQYEAVFSNGVLLAMNGMNQSETTQAAALVNTLQDTFLPISGLLAAGDLRLGSTIQAGGNQSGLNSVSAVLFGGAFHLTTGYAHGWNRVGRYFTAAHGHDPLIIQSLDNAPPAEAYASCFRNTPADWLNSPLQELVRLYPLEVEGDLVSPICSPLLFQADGTLLMSKPLGEGQVVHILSGSSQECLAAARRAARKARDEMGEDTPLLGLLSVDQAWGYLFETAPDLLTNVIREELGGLPLIGIYTTGQICRNGKLPPVLLNQQLVITLIGEKAGS